MVRQVKLALDSLTSLFIPVRFRKPTPYSFADFQGDLLAGITVAVVQIPQAMALALIAGLPAIYGLYASLPGFIASIWGSSRYLSTGPVAIVSLLTFTSLVPLAEPGSPAFIALAALLALMVGCMYLALGVLRLGFIMRAVPNSVITGFSVAAAAIIVVSQLPTLFGITTVRHDLVVQDLLALLRNLPHLSLIAASLGVGTLALLLLARRLPRTFPTALTVVGGGIALSYLLHLDETGIALVSAISPGLPSFTLPAISIAQLLALLPKAAVIALVGFVGTHATSKSAARGTHDKLDTDQELVGQGLANIATSFWRGFPLAGSFTRTAINAEAGARSEFSSLVTAVATIFTILFLTPVLAHLPRTILAAIVIASALPLIDIKGLRHMMRLSAHDGWVAYLTAAMACVARLDDAIFIGIIAALALFIRETISRERIVEMGVDRNWHVLRGTLSDEHVDTLPGTCIVRIGMSLYYANTEHLLAEVNRRIVAHQEREKIPVTTLIFDMAGVHFVDITALEILENYLQTLSERKIRAYFMYLRGPVREVFAQVPALSTIRNLHNITELQKIVGAGHGALLLQ